MGEPNERRPWSEWARASVVPVLLVGLAAMQLSPGLRDGLSPPISWDHGAHLGKAMLTARELLPALRGWSDSIEAGVPLNTLYSVGGTAFLLLVRALTPFLDWLGTYALAIVAVRSLVALSVHRLVRAAGGGRVAGFAAGVFALADHGDHSEGGWFYDIQFGVWPVSLAIALFLFGFADVVEARRRGRAGLLPRSALLIGAALVSHQMCLLGLVVFAPAFVVMRWLDREPSEPSPLADDVRTLFFTAGTALLLSSVWLVPMLAHRDEMSQHGQLYRSLADLGRGALTGEFVLRSGAFTAVVCAFGVLRGLFSTGPRRYLAVVAVLLLFISSRDWLFASGILRVVPALGAIMYPRFMMLAKPLYFASAGLLLGELFVAAYGETRRRLGERRGWASLGLVILLIAPFSRGLYAGLLETVVRREVAYAGSDPLFQDFLAYARWERSRARADGYYRVAYHNTESHLFQAAPAFTGRPAHKIGMLIAEVFGNTTPSGSPAALAAMNVRRVVSVGEPPPTIRGQSHLVARFGRIRVDDLDDFDPRVALDPSGATSPRVVGMSRDSVVVEPRGARSLVIRRAYARAFSADADGRRLDVSPEPVPGASPLRLVRLEVPAGARRVALRYQAWSAVDVAGAFFTGFGVVLLALVSIPHRSVRQLRERVASAWTSATRWTSSSQARRGLFVLGAVLVLGFVFSRVFSRSFDANAELDRAVVEIVDPSGGRTPCDAPRLDGGRGVQCPMADWTYVGTTVQAVEGRLRECIWAHPLGGTQRLSIAFPDSELGGSLVVGAGIGDEAFGHGGVDVQLQVSVDDSPLGTLSLPWQSRWVEQSFTVSPGTRRVTFEVVAPDPSRRFVCFEAWSPRGQTRATR